MYLWTTTDVGHLETTTQLIDLRHIESIYTILLLSMMIATRIFEEINNVKKIWVSFASC